MILRRLWKFLRNKRKKRAKEVNVPLVFKAKRAALDGYLQRLFPRMIYPASLYWMPPLTFIVREKIIRELSGPSRGTP